MLRTLAVLLALILPATAELDLTAPLPVDPNVNKMGQLPNGLRYWIRVNKTPPGKASLMLHVGSGSLNEEEDQRGLAHFLEHMAFNGSQHFPPGELIKYFESLGMQFGMHQNAFTSFNQTTYMMRIPDTKKETLERVFLYFGDVAHRLTLPDKEIDKERGVIMEEKRSRMGAGQRMMEKLLPMLFPDSRLAERLPIGLEAVITGAPRERFENYYKTWYRPDNSTVIACGDFDPAQIEAMIKEAFKDWKATGEKPQDAAAGVKFDNSLRAGVITDPDVTVARVGWGFMSPKRPLATVGDLRREMVEDLGSWIVNRRMREMVQKGEATFQNGGVGTGEFLGYVRTTDVDGSGKPGEWATVLREILLEAKRASVHGFTDTELADAKKATLSAVEQAAKAEATRDSFAMIQGLNNAVTAGRNPMSSAQGAELTAKLLPTITRAEVEKAFRENFVFDRGLVLATLPEKEGIVKPTKEQLLAVLAEVAKADVTKRAEEKRAKGLLVKDPEPGAVAESAEDKELGVVSVTMKNGVRAHVRSMDYQKDAVLLQMTLVGGAIDETAANKGVTSIAAMGLTPGQGATKRHSTTDLTNLLTGRKFGMGATASDAYLTISMRASPDEIEDAFRLVHLMLTQGQVDAESLKRWKQQMTFQLPQMAKNVPAQAQLEWSALLSGRDVRLTLPTQADVDRQTVAEAQKWLEHLVATAPIEVAVVGDIERDKALALAVKYLGSLAARPHERADIAALRKLEVAEGPQVVTVEVDTVTPQAMVRQGWRGPGIGKRRDSRLLFFAAQILTARLNTVIREEKQLTYSIQAGSSPSIAYDGNGALLCGFTADPAKAEEAAKIARKVMEDLIGDKPPTEDEMAAVSKQIANMIDTQIKMPAFWANTLSTLKTRGRPLDSLKDIRTVFTSFKAEEIVECVKKYMKADRYVQVIAKPKPK